jgi:tetratricopeptide (TPR) repeat protein
MAERGSWSGLAGAVAAAAALNAALVSSLLWTDLIAGQLRIICWVLVGISWGGAGGLSAWWYRRQEARRSDPEPEPFEHLVETYLQGNWIEAERLLGRFLRRDPHDLDARLMLATLLRHTKRFDEATRQLNDLVRRDGAERWALEIRREGELLSEARRTAASENLKN